jgi:acetylornithine deacetylase/succinyl-diaminopimelate desuccinylase-like protein
MNLMKTLALLVLAIGTMLTAAALPPKPDQELARAIYKEFVELKSGFSTGSTTIVAEAAAARLRSAGFPDSDIFIGGPVPNKANLVVRYHGAGKAKPILLLAHTDVVEAKREDWSMDPFQFVEKDGYFYGRGTGDDKAQAAVWIANLIRYKKEGYKPDRDIIVALTADEEGGGPYNGVAWLLKAHRDLIDAEYCLNEGGWGELNAAGKHISNNVQVSEKYVINFRLEVRNKGGHSSMPVPDNAIYHLAGALYKLSQYQFPLKTNEVTQTYFEELSRSAQGPVQSTLAKVRTGSDEVLKEIAAVSPGWNATLRTTCVATELQGGHAKNALPQLAAANVNCRVLPEDSSQYVQNTLETVIDDPQVKISIEGEVNRGPASSLRPDLMKGVKRVTDSIWPGVPATPMMVMGATDGAYLRASGFPTYGVQGFFLAPEDMRFHGRDERMPVQSFYEGEQFLYSLVKVLTGGE